jgi:CRP/FNR family transcriptional regulator
MDFDIKILSFLQPELIEKLLNSSKMVDVPKGTEILKEHQYVKHLPIVIQGLVKVYSRFDEKDLLLYYIEPSNSCIMTFNAALKNTPSKVYAITEEDSKLLLIPVSQLPVWLKEYPYFNEFFFNQFNLRYSELLDTIRHLLLDKMDKRVYDHLKKKSLLINDEFIKMSHNQISTELGTAREVVTRVLKKLEIDGKIVQLSEGIKILSNW